jgi:hypothetical protein
VLGGWGRAGHLGMVHPSLYGKVTWPHNAACQSAFRSKNRERRSSADMARLRVGWQHGTVLRARDLVRREPCRAAHRGDVL